jgi:photosystem I P700 chlorophyll a apoprotein A1
MYNSVSVLIFGYFWKMQSDVQFSSSGDFSVNSTSINGWLRNFLWSQAAQVIQSYGTNLAAYGLIFLGAHFVWPSA